MKQYHYLNEIDYRQAQCEANKRKLLQTWSTEAEMKLITQKLRYKNPKKGLCHGSRNGFEVEALRQHLPGVAIIGTDIAPTAKDFPNMVCWDFSIANPDWKEMDFIYSNSLDHARDPKACLKTWYNTLRKGGQLFVNWSSHNYEVDNVDCFAASEDELTVLLQEAGFQIIEIIEHDERTNAIGRILRRFRNSILKRIERRYFTSQEIPKRIFHVQK